jgi:hypothetical protein
MIPSKHHNRAKPTVVEHESKRRQLQSVYPACLDSLKTCSEFVAD